MTLYNIIHGAEFWLAGAIFLLVIDCGLLLWEFIEWLGGKK